MLHREDVYCPACPDPETAFRIEDVGTTFNFEGDFRTDGSLRFTASRPAWEPVMIEHLRLTDDERHQQLYGQSLSSLETLGKTAEQAAWDSVQAAADWGRRSIERTHRPVPTVRAETTAPLSFTAMREAAERQTMQSVRPVALPEPTTSTVCRRRNLVISESRQWAHDEACGCQR